MPYCSNCRTYITDGTDTCPKCGNKDSRYANTPPKPQVSTQGQHNAKQTTPFIRFLKNFLKTEDMTYGFVSSDISANSNSAVLAYLGPLVIIPLIIARKSKFAMFHCCQGLMNSVFGLLYITVAPIIINTISPIIAILLLIPFFAFLALFPIAMVLGIVNAIRGKAITLPIFGRIDLMRVLFKNL